MKSLLSALLVAVSFAGPAFAASDGDLHADKHGFEARRRRVMAQQDGGGR